MARRTYKAFISYSHADKDWASWLHRKLESYAPPRAITADRNWPAHPLAPVFRDRDDMVARGELGEELKAILEAAEHLIVICSPAAHRSRWVSEEIRAFRAIHGQKNVLALIVDGDPIGGPETNCFPDALRDPLEPGGPPTEPVAADARKEADGKRYAFLKIAAGLLDVSLNDLVQREAARRQRRLAAAAIAATAGMGVTAALGALAESQRREAVRQRTIAEENERTAEATVDYLVDTFRVADPQTENPAEISALTVLDRGAERIETSLADQPKTRGRLYNAIGSIYVNLGEYDRGERALQTGYELLEPSSMLAKSNRLSLGLARLEQGEVNESLEIASDLLSDLDTSDSDQAALAAWAYHLEGIGRFELYEMEKAKAALESSLAIIPPDSDDYEYVRLINLEYLASVARELREFEEASALFNEVVGLIGQEFGESSLRYARALNNYSLLRIETGEFEQALELNLASYELFERLLGESHRSLPNALMNRGRILDALGDSARAVSVYEKALAQLNAIYPEGHARIAFTQIFLAMALSQLGEFDRALALMNDAGTEYDRHYGGLHANHGDLAVHRAVVLARAGRLDEARGSCAYGLQVLGDTIGADSPATGALKEMCRDAGAL